MLKDETVEKNGAKLLIYALTCQRATAFGGDALIAQSQTAILVKGSADSDRICKEFARVPS